MAARAKQIKIVAQFSLKKASIAFPPPNQLSNRLGFSIALQHSFFIARSKEQINDECSKDKGYRGADGEHTSGKERTPLVNA